jgi:hypothetical protein
MVEHANKKMRLGEHIAGVGENLIGKLEGKRPIWSHGRRSEYNIKNDLR